MPLWLQAGLWGWLGGGALVIGAALGWGLKRRPRLVASVMAFGAGHDLVGFITVLGFLAAFALSKQGQW